MNEAPGFSVGSAEGGTLRPRGALVFATARKALEQLIACLPDGGSMAVDLAQVEGDSAGLAVLVEWQSEANRRGVHLRYAGASAGLRALARLSDLDAELFG
jgi:ABC-type transporter Mla MlaB component